jgi:uncharacterized protein YjbJ (UPF0337 family)
MMTLPTINIYNTKGVNNMTVKLNQDIVEGKWKQVKGKVRQQWGKLTDDQLDQISGRAEELAGLLQENYGYSVARAQKEVDDFFNRLDTHEHMR